MQFSLDLYIVHNNHHLYHWGSGGFWLIDTNVAWANPAADGSVYIAYIDGELFQYQAQGADPSFTYLASNTAV